MGIPKQKLTEDHKSSKKTHHKQPKPPAIANRRTGRKPRSTTDDEPTSPAKNTGAPDDESTSLETELELKPGEAGEWLRTAIEKQVRLECRKLARALIRKATAGDIRALGLAIEVTGARVKGPRDLPVKKPRRQILPWRAAELAAQPDWKGPTEAEEDKMFAKTLETAV
jgi:hypothetical protein